MRPQFAAAGADLGRTLGEMPGGERVKCKARAFSLVPQRRHGQLRTREDARAYISAHRHARQVYNPEFVR